MGRVDRRDNRVTIYTPTRRPTRRPTKHLSPHVKRDGWRDGNVTVLKKIALPIAHVVALVCCPNDEIVCLKNRRDARHRVGRRAGNRVGVLRASHLRPGNQ